jgi:transcriptional regulator with XRE-family HTH domain
VSLIPSWCQELRAARLVRGWSEDDLADQIQNWEYRHGAGRHLGVSRSYVSEWETGKRGVSRDYAIRIEGVTGIPGDHFIDHRSSRGRVVRLQEAEVGLQWADDLDGAVEVLIALWRSRLDRREFLAAMAATAVISEVALRWLVSPADEQVKRDAGSRWVGDSDLDAVRAMQQSMKAIDDKHGGGVALPMAAEYLRGEVAPLLRARYTDTAGRALFSATSEFTLGVGWMAYDAGKHGLAQRYMAQALRMSHAANNRAFGGRILAAMSHQALHLGDVRHGLDFACAARAGTQARSRRPRWRCWPPWKPAPMPLAVTPRCACGRCRTPSGPSTDPTRRRILCGSTSMRAGSQGTWHAASATSIAPVRLSSSRSGQSSSAIPRTCGLASSATPSLPAPTPNRATLRAHARSVAKRLRR